MLLAAAPLEKSFAGVIVFTNLVCQSVLMPTKTRQYAAHSLLEEHNYGYKSFREDWQFPV